MSFCNRKLPLLSVVPIILIGLLLQGCGATVPEYGDEKIGTVNVLGVWDGDELESFQAMVAPWEEQTGGAMAFSGTRDLIALRGKCRNYVKRFMLPFAFR